MKIYELWKTVSNLPCYALKISNSSNSYTEERWVFLTWRVHPGESNSSFMMEGLLNQLLCSQDIKSKFTYYIIPFMNPDGVYFGRYRWNMIGTDLNRIWHWPSKYFHPTVYFAKELLQQLHNGKYFQEISDFSNFQQEDKDEEKILNLINNYSLSRDWFQTPKSKVNFK